LRLASRGGAEMLGRADCGQIAVGKRADFVIWDMTGVETAGAWDPVAALVLCAPVGVRETFVEGKAVVREGRLARAELRDIQAGAAASLKRLMS